MATVSCGGTSARYRFIEKFGRELGIKRTCEWLGVSRSGYYAWLNREPSQRDRSDKELRLHIKRISDENEGRYGSPRIWKTLLKQGFQVSRKRIARLMQEMGLIARVTKVTYRAPGLRRFLASVENLRPEGAVPEAKDKVWVADVTYLKVKKQWHYLSVIMDLYSRRIIGWSLDTKRTTAVTGRTLKTAVRKRRPSEGLMLHKNYMDGHSKRESISILLEAKPVD